MYIDQPSPADRLHFWWHKQKKSRANTVTQGYANGSWIDTITATPFRQSSCLVFAHWALSNPARSSLSSSSLQQLNASREEINVAMETARLLTGANFCLHESDSIESWCDSSKLIAHGEADLKHLWTGYLNTNCICSNCFLLNKSHSSPYCARERRLAIDLAT